LYHFLVHDTSGPIGKSLRWCCTWLGMRDNPPMDTFATLILSIWMQLDGILVWAQTLRWSFCDICRLKCHASQQQQQESLPMNREHNDNENLITKSSLLSKKRQGKKSLQSPPPPFDNNLNKDQKTVRNNSSKQSRRKRRFNVKAD
jgi:hypothetical protein